MKDLCVISLFLLPLLVYSCGILTHQEVGHRAAYFFHSDPFYKKLIQNHQDAYQASTPFPDWGYLCGKYDPKLHNVGEDTHWPPFITTAANYIYENLKKPWTEEDEKLVAFVMGIQSHSISDIVWHSLRGIKDGFITTDSKICFNNKWEEAHSNCDQGGDALRSYSMSSDYISDQWYIPSYHLSKIYQKFNPRYTFVTKEVIDICSFAMYTVSLIERLIFIIYPIYAKRSHFLVDHYIDFHIGGVDDMAMRSNFDFNEIINIIENGTTEIPKKGNYKIEENDEMQFKELLLEKYHDIITKLEPYMNKTKNGIYFSTKRTIEEVFPNLVKQNKNVKLNFNFPVSDYAYTGHSLAKFSKKGEPDTLLVGAPGFSLPGKPQIGAVHIKKGEDITTIFGKDKYSKFGWQIITSHFNEDEHEDLIVSAPNFGSVNSYYPKGTIFVFYGNGNSFSKEPDVTIYGDSDDTLLGYTLSSGDIDGDNKKELIIGSPFDDSQRGTVTIYSSKRRNSTILVNSRDADITIKGENTYNWFGYHLNVFENSTNSLLIIGAPVVNQGRQIQSIGKLYAYEIKKIDNKYFTRIKFTINGVDEFDRTGAMSAIGRPFSNKFPILALASPTRTIKNSLRQESQAGEVILIQFDKLFGNYSIKNVPFISNIEGNQGFARLGDFLTFGDVNDDGIDDLIIGEPNRDVRNVGNVAGAIYTFYGNNIPSGDIDLDKADRIIYHNVPYSNFGKKVVIGKFNQSHQTNMIVSAPRESYRMNGNLYIF